MSEFIAKIKAVLDTSKAEQQLKELENKQIKIGVEVDGQKEIPKVNQEIVKAKKSSDSFGDALKKALNIGSAASIVYNGIRLIRNAMKDAVEAVKEYDAAVTELRMATGGNYDETLDLVKTYNSLGQNLGATTKEVSESANAWLRQGKTISETNTLIRDSMILSKVGNIKAADATEYLTSSIKGFKISANDALSVVDKLAAVDLSAAVDAGGLAEGMSRVAVTANMAGVSMDRLLGYLATVGEVTQKSMSSVGESFKTIFTRMNDIKDDSFDMISGTNGLLGAADGAFILQKEKRTSNKATLDISGRDQQDQRLELVRNAENLTWELVKAEVELWKEPPEPLLVEIAKHITPDCPKWQGTATELATLLHSDLSPNALTKKLNVIAGRLLNEFGVRYETFRKRDGRFITLTLNQA